MSITQKKRIQRSSNPKKALKHRFLRIKTACSPSNTGASSYGISSKKTQLTWPDTTAIGYSYSQHGQLESVSIPGEGNISVAQFKWLEPAQVTLPGGTAQDRTLDGLLNLESLKVKTPGQQTVLSLANAYGKVQELKTSNRTDSAGSSGSASTSKASQYSYDDETRLTQAKTDTGGLFGTDTENFTLDAVGNRIAHSKVTGAWLYDANNRLTQRGTGTNATTYQYDDAGNLTQKTEPGNKVTQYSYDTQNRLIEVNNTSNAQASVQSQLVARYGYDPLDRRIWKEQYKSADGQALAQPLRTYYLYADEGLIAESTQAITLNADGSVTAGAAPQITTQYGSRPNSDFTTGVLFVKTTNSSNQKSFAYLHHDHLQTPLQATDKAGNVVWAASYNAFGKAAITTPAATADKPTININLRLPGQYLDEETGLHYNWHRYYDADTGRYVTADPIGLRGGINTYGYGEASPLMYSDPMGLWVWGDPIDQGVVNAVTGFGDAFLIPELIRSALDIDGGVDQCSAAYRVGKATGFAVGAVPFGLELGTVLATTKFLSIINKNRYLRIGPGKASAGARFGLGGGRNVPMLRIGNGKPSDLNHIDLRSRLPKVAPLGGPAECGCP